MPHERRTSYTGREYGEWHRLKYISRYLGKEIARTLTMIDIDGKIHNTHLSMDERHYIECTQIGCRPIALVEAACEDTEPQDTKVATAIRELARQANTFAFIVLYTTKVNEYLDLDCSIKDIAGFRVKPVSCPTWSHAYDGWTKWCALTPQEYAEFLVELRDEFPKDKDFLDRCDLEAVWKRSSPSVVAAFVAAFLAEKSSTEVRGRPPLAVMPWVTHPIRKVG